MSFAENMQTNNSVIYNYLSGARIPTVAMLVKMANYFHVTTDYLLGLASDSYAQSFHIPPPFCERFQYLLKYFNKSKYSVYTTLKISSSNVNTWASGKHFPSLESVIRLAGFFDCTVDFVIGREN